MKTQQITLRALHRRRCARLFLALTITVGTCLGHGHAEAAIATFTDQTSFLNAGAGSPTEPIPRIGRLDRGASGTIGDLTFTLGPDATRFFFGSDPNNAPLTTRLPGNQIGVSGVENLNIDFAHPVFSLGFDFVEPEFDPNVGDTFVDSVFQLTFLNGGVPVDSFTFNAPNDTASFAGAWLDTQFNRVEIREIVGDSENEFFGQFYTGMVPIPEPSTLLLLGLGILFAAGRRFYKT